jgi:AraC-like DNA-binding protein
MAPIDDAIAELKSHEAGERPSYKDCAAKFGVDRNTLSRRFRGAQGSVHAQTINKQKLDPQ